MEEVERYVCSTFSTRVGIDQYLLWIGRQQSCAISLYEVDIRPTVCNEENWLRDINSKIQVNISQRVISKRKKERKKKIAITLSTIPPRLRRAGAAYGLGNLTAIKSFCPFRPIYIGIRI